MTPRATIALLNWNGGDFVRLCLDSVLRQSEQDIEIVVVDNHSSDGSADVIEALLDASSVKYELVRLDENRGICGGLQVALDRATGEYFFPFPSGDRIQPHRVGRQGHPLPPAAATNHHAATPGAPAPHAPAPAAATGSGPKWPSSPPSLTKTAKRVPAPGTHKRL